MPSPGALRFRGARCNLFPGILNRSPQGADMVSPSQPLPKRGSESSDWWCHPATLAALLILLVVAAYCPPCAPALSGMMTPMSPRIRCSRTPTDFAKSGSHPQTVAVFPAGLHHVPAGTRPVGLQPAWLSLGQRAVAFVECGSGLARLEAPPNPRRLAGGGHFCTAPRPGRIRGLGHRAEELESLLF